MSRAENSKRFREAHPDYYSTPERLESRRRSQAKLAEDPEWRAKRVEQERERRYRRLYGISVAEYDELLEAQNGACAICQRPPKTRRLAVDHDHKTGALRGLLCFRCNATLHNRVTAEWLELATAYLREPPAPEVLGRVVLGRVGSTKRRRKKGER
jgi:hypothetical protein